MPKTKETKRREAAERDAVSHHDKVGRKARTGELDPERYPTQPDWAGGTDWYTVRNPNV